MTLFAYFCTIGLFVLLGSAFLFVRVPLETRRLERDAGAGPPLRGAQRFNVGLVLFVSQALQVLFVSLAIGIFFTVFGVLAINEETRDRLDRRRRHKRRLVHARGHRLRTHPELLRVAGGLAAFSGFYFAVAMLTDSTYREEFLTELTAEMSESFKARAAYLRIVGAAA